MEARYFTASSLGLWFSGVSDPDPGGILATLVPLVDVLGESNGVNGGSGEESEAAEERDRFHCSQHHDGDVHSGTVNV